MSDIQNSIAAGRQPASVVDMGTPDAMWSRCRQIAISRLTQGLAMALSYVQGDLAEQAKHARDMNHYRLLEQGKDVLRHSRDGIVSSFQRRFGEYTDPDATTGLEADSGETFSLMADQEMHDSATHDVVAQTILTVCDIELRALNRRFKDLAAASGQKASSHPFGPELIGRTVLIALRERDVSLTLRRLLAPMIAEHFAEGIRVLYQDILDLFAGKGLYATGKASQSLAPQGGMGGTGASRSDEAALERDTPATSGPAKSAPAPVRGRAITAAILALTRLQRGEIQLASTYAPDTAEILHRLAETKFITDLGNSGLLALNMVTALCEAVLNDKRVPASVKAEVARLQVPLFKAALLDNAVLKQPNHPARQLLDTVAEAGRNAYQLTDRAAFELALKQLVDTITANFEEDLGMFGTASQSVRHQIDRLQPRPGKQDAVQTAPLPKPDKDAFRRQIKLETQDTKLPKTVLAFLFEHWETLHRAVYTLPAQTDVTMADPSMALSSLIRTLEPENWHENRTAMLGLLPSVLKRLKSGLQTAQASQERQDKFLAGLAKCHAVVMQTAKEMAIPTPAAATTMQQAAPTAPAKVTASHDQMAMPASASKSDRHEALVRTLQRGALIEFRDQGGSMSWLKLAWISPNGGIFVFTNKQGERALTINASALAERFRQEQARVAIDTTVREGSPSRMIGGLQNVA